MAFYYPDPQLESTSVRLRKWSVNDLACIEAASADPEIPQGTTVPAVYSEPEGLAFIERQLARQTSGQGLSLAIADTATDVAKGLVFLGLNRIRGHCRLGYWLIPDARGHRRGTQAVAMASRWVLTETDTHRLVAQVVPKNVASVALLRRLGFVEEGVLRSWLWIKDEAVDVIQFSLLRSDIA